MSLHLKFHQNLFFKANISLQQSVSFEGVLNAARNNVWTSKPFWLIQWSLLPWERYGRLGFILIHNICFNTKSKGKWCPLISFYWHYWQVPKLTELYWLKNAKTEYDNPMFYTQKVPQSSIVVLHLLASYSLCHWIQWYWFIYGNAKLRSMEINFQIQMIIQ